MLWEQVFASNFLGHIDANFTPIYESVKDAANIYLMEAG